MLIFSQLQQSHHILLFNSQSLKETDQYRVYYGITKKAFQHSRRLTGTGARMASLHRNFNSQPHKEADEKDDPSNYLIFKMWEKNGYRRIYVNDYKKRTVAYIDCNANNSVESEYSKGDIIETIKYFIENYEF